jgi:uncharacterized membrane protein
MKLCEKLGFALIAASILGVWVNPRLGSLYAVGVVVVIIARLIEHRRVHQ